MGDGYDWREEDKCPPPVGLMDILRKRDPVQIALSTFHERETLRPVDVPSLPVPSEALETVLRARTPSTVDKDLRAEHGAYCKARDKRIGAKAENARRLRTSLWAEQCLRAAGKPEHRLMRAFNMQAWGMQEPASDDVAVREQQVRAHA